jgi:hypothetical protein
MAMAQSMMGAIGQSMQPPAPWFPPPAAAPVASAADTKFCVECVRGSRAG